MVDQVEIHRKVVSDDVEERREAVRLLRDNFADLPDKEEAWRDLIQLTGDENWEVREHVADAFGSVFPHVIEKEEAWGDMVWLMTDDEGWEVRWNVAGVLNSCLFVPVSEHALDSIFQHIIENEKAWNDLHRLTHHEDGRIRITATYSLGRASILKAANAESEDGFKIELKNAIDFFEISSKGAT